MAGRPRTSQPPKALLRLLVAACLLLPGGPLLHVAHADARPSQVDADTGSGGSAPLPGAGSDVGSGGSAPIPGGTDGDGTTGGSAPLPGSGGSSDAGAGAAPPPPVGATTSPSSTSTLNGGNTSASGTGQSAYGYIPPPAPAFADGVQGAAAPDPLGTSDVDQSFVGGVVGQAIANTGFNTALNRNLAGNTFAGSGLLDPLGVIANSSNGGALIGSGDANARGSYDTNAIHQQVVAYTDGTGTIDILQVALIVNIGVSHATSGSNTALGLAHGATGQLPAGSANPTTAETQNGTSKTKTGNATATGNQGSSLVKQGASVGGGENVSQNATLINIGIGIGNTGFNIVIGNINVSAAPTSGSSGESGWATTVRSGTSDIGSGAASAVGNLSTTQIAQIAVASALNGGSLSISQQAFVINFGFALANTGGNVGVGDIGGGQVTGQQQALATSILAALIPLIGQTVGNTPTPDAGPLGGGTYSATGTSTIATGNALSVGNDTKTGVVQQAEGTVDGRSANLSQTAMIGNFGFGIANTGANAGIGNVEPSAVEQLSPAVVNAQHQLTGFLSLLTNPGFLTSANPQATLKSVIDLGVAALTLSGDISAADLLAAWDSNLPVPIGMPFAGLRVRQISAVLDIGIAFADSGANTAVGIISNHHNQIAPQTVDENTTVNASTDTLVAGNHRVGVAGVDSGDAFALGSSFAVFLCQIEMIDDTFCARASEAAVDPERETAARPAPTPDPVSVPVPVAHVEPAVTVVAGPAAAEPAVVAAGSQGGQLPFTGAQAALLALVGLALVAAGGLSVGAGRRRGTAGRR